MALLLISRNKKGSFSLSHLSLDKAFEREEHESNSLGTHLRSICSHIFFLMTSVHVEKFQNISQLHLLFQKIQVILI